MWSGLPFCEGLEQENLLPAVFRNDCFSPTPSISDTYGQCGLREVQVVRAEPRRDVLQGVVSQTAPTAVSSKSRTEPGICALLVRTLGSWLPLRFAP